MLKVIRKKSDLKEAVGSFKQKGKTIGLVPTMGALHSGHLSLVELSHSQYDVTVVSIFVNPTQFNNKEDLDKYPRSEESDINLLSKTSCDLVFIPSADEMYASTPLIKLDFGYLENIMEGKFRPGHFNGVGLVVAKLLGLTEPNGAFFGQKDIQQFRVISALVKDLDIPVKLHMAPIVREMSGLAMSSRNERLNDEQKSTASNLFKSLQIAAKLITSGNSLEKAKKEAFEFLGQLKNIELEYFEIVDFETLQNIPSVNKGEQLVLCLAAHIGGIRLIDNIVIEL